jgi:hypothetical protein
MARHQSLFLSKLLALFSTHVDNGAKVRAPATRTSSRRLLVLERVFDTADSILDLSCHLVGLALRLQLGIANHLARDLLDFPFDFLRRSLEKEYPKIKAMARKWRAIP